MHKIWIIHGPNLNLLGTREPETYGHVTLNELNKALLSQALPQHAELLCQQFNDEGAIINCIHQAKLQAVNMLIINAGAYTHTSIAIRDALLGVAIPLIEVHLSNVYAREPFRHQSYLSDIALGTIGGFGTQSYHLALEAALHYLSSHS
ncbi:MAG: type II 3-dehydroquinate dehydratase [Legionellales bacterium]|nr:type II 3-dehydroquinate dehydratase [Legionellales bacterium]